MSDFTCAGDTPFNNHYKAAAHIAVWGTNSPHVRNNLLYRTIHHSASGIFYYPGYIQYGEFCEQRSNYFGWCPEFTPVQGMLFDVILPEGQQMTLTLSAKQQGSDKTVYESETVSVEFQNIDWGAGVHTYMDTVVFSAEAENFIPMGPVNEFSNPCPGGIIKQAACTVYTINNVKSYDFKIYAVDCGVTQGIFNNFGQQIGTQKTGYIYAVYNNVKLVGGDQAEDYAIQGPTTFTISCGNPPFVNGGSLFTVYDGGDGPNVLSSLSPYCKIYILGFNLRVV